MNTVVKAYLQLMRPANLPTAAADIIAGIAIAGYFTHLSLDAMLMTPIVLLVLASVFLYAGGVVLNDFFDHKLDLIERPERPIPSGKVKPIQAKIFGFSLLLIGIATAFFVSSLSGIISVFLALMILSYDAYAKHYKLLGPINMGVCRGLNLLVGLSIAGKLIHWQYALIPIVFIAAITMISQGEVHGKNKKNILLAGFLYVLVIFSVVGLHEVYGGLNRQYILILILFSLMVFLPLFKAYKINSPENIKKAVKAGVISLILLDAAVAMGYANWQVGLLLILLLPLSIFLSKIFAVT